MKSNIVSVKRKRFNGVPVPPIKRQVTPLPPALSDETKRRLLFAAVARVQVG